MTDDLVKQIKADLDTSRKNLIAQMKALCRDLERTINRLEEDSNSEICSIGIVQGRGSTIDALCATYSQAQDYLDFFELGEE